MPEKRRREKAAIAAKERPGKLREWFGQSITRRILDKEIWLGMTTEIVRESWGLARKASVTGSQVALVLA